jgi:hypothetical protein
MSKGAPAGHGRLNLRDVLQHGKTCDGAASITRGMSHQLSKGAGASRRSALGMIAVGRLEINEESTYVSFGLCIRDGGIGYHVTIQTDRRLRLFEPWTRERITIPHTGTMTACPRFFREARGIPGDQCPAVDSDQVTEISNMTAECLGRVPTYTSSW